jgi:PAS domain S-box-containing protein
MTDESAVGSSDTLRQRAEKKARQRAGRMSENLAALTPENTRRLVHELRVHEIELEMQNEELRRTWLELEASRRRYFDLYDLAPVGYLTLGEKGLVREANLASARLLGVDRSQVVRQPLSRFILPEDQDLYYRLRQLLFKTGAPQACELRLLRAGAPPFWARLEAAMGQTSDGQPLGRFILSDVSATRQAQEESLRQAQKMESVGQMVGGIAHDFNNVLTTIIGYNWFLLDALPPGHELRPFSLEIRRQSEVAASLTRQFMAFNRKQAAQPRVMDLNTMVVEMSRVFRHLLGDGIKLAVQAHPSLWPVNMDSGQVEQVILNLVINARDAMPRGGRLSVSTKNTSWGEKGPADPAVALPPGHYVCLEVRDTGVGMDEDLRRRIFEPFFTTKGLGRGTGLGLAMVQGIVKEAGGGISVDSRPGEGSAFCVYLPRAAGGSAAMLPGDVPKSSRGGRETILVVEDNAALRLIIKKTLRLKGYRVFSAAGAEEALGHCRRLKERIDLLLVDVVLPDQNGPELAARLGVERPGLRTVFMSGYAGATLSLPNLARETPVLEKPFSPETLLGTLRQVFDAKAEA